MNLQDAAQQIFGSTSEQQPTEDQEAAEMPDGDESPEVEASTADTEDQTAETPDGDTKQEEQTYTVKVNGEEKEVTIEDLRKGYMMESDYRKKTTKVSEDRKALDLKTQEIDKLLSDAKTLADNDLDWFESTEAKELKEDDPSEYLERLEKAKAKQEAIKTLKSKRQKDKDDQHSKYINEQIEKLNQAIPEWLDQDVKDGDFKKLRKTMEKLGFTNDEFNQVSDHRLLVMARKAALYDELQTKDIDAKKVKKAPQSMKPGRSGQVDAVSEDRKKAMSKLKKSGKLQDAAMLLNMR